MLLRDGAEPAVGDHRNSLVGPHVLLKEPHRGEGAIAADAVGLSTGEEACRLEPLLNVRYRHRLSRVRCVYTERELVTARCDLGHPDTGDLLDMPYIGIARRGRHARIDEPS